MTNVPLHPMVVHFPIVLSILFPIFACTALWRLRHGGASRRIWAGPAVLAVALVASSFAAVRTGEAEEQRVERIVAENVLHEHEEAAERFIMMAVVVATCALVGMGRGKLGAAARYTATAGSLVIVLFAFRVGKAGGELVYEHNAAAAYVHSPQSR